MKYQGIFLTGFIITMYVVYVIQKLVCVYITN